MLDSTHYRPDRLFRLLEVIYRRRLPIEARVLLQILATELEMLPEQYKAEIEAAYQLTERSRSGVEEQSQLLRLGLLRLRYLMDVEVAPIWRRKVRITCRND